MSRRKVVLVIVEGPSDETALGVVLSKVFDRDQVYVHVVHGDVTSDVGTTTANVVKKVYEFVKRTMDRYRLTKANMLQVIHLMDSDGAYVPDNLVIEDQLADQTVYFTDHIVTQNREGILDRNERFATPAEGGGNAVIEPCTGGV